MSDRESPGVEGTMAYLCLDECYTWHVDAHVPCLAPKIEPNTEGHFLKEPTDSASRAKFI